MSNELFGAPAGPPRGMPQVHLIELIVHLPSGPRSFKKEEITAFDPSVPALAWIDAEGRTHNLIGFPFEAIYEESRIARVA